MDTVDAAGAVTALHQTHAVSMIAASEHLMLLNTAGDPAPTDPDYIAW